MRRVTDWVIIGSLATAAGTLALAGATFASIRSANRSARNAERAGRIAERSLLAGQRPLLVSSRLQDPAQKVQFAEGNWLTVAGGGAAAQATDGAIYLGISVRNVGTGLAVMHGWHGLVDRPTERAHPPLEEFTSQIRDIYIAPGDIGIWQGAIRDPADAAFQAAAAAIKAGDLLLLSVLYGDFEGGQRVISQFALRYLRSEEDPERDRWLASAARHFNVDRPDPR